MFSLSSALAEKLEKLDTKLVVIFRKIDIKTFKITIIT